MNSSRQPRILNPQPHAGEHNELVIGIDVGTTFSGVCYAFLRPGEIPQIHSVTRFTDQTSGDSKIPSIMYYDEDMNLRAAGATAVSEIVVQEAEFEGWHRVQYFKMHMKPPNMKLETHGLKIDALPETKTVTDVMTDFLRYLYMETLRYITINHSDSTELLNSVSGHIKFVLSHPNGWTGLPQQRMREAAVLGGLVDSMENARSKIRFVSEGEASALSCLAGGFCPPNLERGYRFMIADLGGGTLDITSYEVTNSSPLRLKELTSSDCRFAGSVFVNMNARELVKKLLQGSHFSNPEILDEAINDHFETTTKRQFKDATKVSWLRVSDCNENDTKLGIRRGRLRIDGKDIAECFDHPVSEALQAIKSQIAKCNGKTMPVWLVGGFAASDWLLSKLKETLSCDGIDVRRPSSIDLYVTFVHSAEEAAHGGLFVESAKAVAHGNVLFSLERTVQSRVTRATYGVKCNTAYWWFDPEHRKREHLKYTSLSGEVRIPGKFDVIVKKNKTVEETEHFTRTYKSDVPEEGSAKLTSKILFYDKDDSAPEWYDENKDKFSVACSIRCDLSRLCCKSDLRTHNGKRYWEVEYEIEIMFGLTELEARYKWEEDGETKYGPATVFYEECSSDLA